jgi:outer membrane receptor for Fe3+-dicitrate
MKKMFVNIWLIFLIFVIPCFSFGEVGEQEVIKLEDITVKGESVPVATTVNVVGAEEFEDLRLDRPIDILEEIPGIEVGNYDQGGVANVFSIRGFGGAGHGGDAAVYIDGIPLNPVW